MLSCVCDVCLHVWCWQTPLHAACKAGHVETVKVLVEAGGSLYAQSADLHYTPLFAAAANGRSEVVRYVNPMLAHPQSLGGVFKVLCCLFAVSTNIILWSDPVVAVVAACCRYLLWEILTPTGPPLDIDARSSTGATALFSACMYPVRCVVALTPP